MRILVRSMAPQIIACDEIGSKEDIEAINYVMCSGVKGIFTAHGNDIEDVCKKIEQKYNEQSDIEMIRNCLLYTSPSPRD